MANEIKFEPLVDQPPPPDEQTYTPPGFKFSPLADQPPPPEEIVREDGTRIPLPVDRPENADVPIPQSFWERAIAGSKFDKLARVFGKAKEGAVEGAGAGFSLTEDEIGKLTEMGLLGSHPIRALSNATVMGSATLLKSLVSALNAGTFAAAGGISQFLVEEGAVGEDKAARFQRDMVSILDTVGLLTAANPSQFSRVRSQTRVTGNTVMDEKVGTIPRTEGDFQKSASVVAGEADAPPHTMGKLKELYEEKGITPYEASADAADDPVLKQNLLAKNRVTDDTYGASKADEKPAAGGGGDAPPPAIPNDRVPDGVPEPPKGSGITREDIAVSNEAFDSRISVGESQAKKSRGIDGFYEDFYDEWHPLYTGTRTEREYMEAWKDPYIMTRHYAGASAKADWQIKEFTFGFNSAEKIGPGFDTIMAPFAADLQPFRRFVTASKAAEMEIRGFDSGFKWEDIQTQGKMRTKQMEDAFEELVKFQNTNIDWLTESGILNKDVAVTIKADNRLYVPWHVFKEAGLSGASAGLQAKNPLHKLTGGDWKLIDPLESVIKNKFISTYMAERNVIGQRIVDSLSELNKVEEIVSDGKALVVPKETKKAVADVLEQAGVRNKSVWDTVSQWAVPEAVDEIAVYRNGVRHTYRVPEEIATAFKQLDKETLSFLEKMMAPFASGLRAGAVLDPTFPVRHMFREYFYAVTSFTKGTLTPVDVAKAMVSRILYKDRKIPGTDKVIPKLDDYFENYIMSGAADSSYVSLDRRYLQDKLDDIAGKTGLMSRAWNVVADPQMLKTEKGAALLGLTGEAAANAVKHPLKTLRRTFIHPLQVATEFALSSYHFAGFRKDLKRMRQEHVAAAKAAGEVNTDALQIADMRGQMVIRDGVSVIEAIQTQQKALLMEPSAKKKMLLEAGWTARETSVDVSTIGAKVGGWNAIAAFANPVLRDQAKLFDMMKNHPVRFSVTVGLGITLPSVGLWWATKDDSRIQALPAWRRHLFWNIPIDKWEQTTAEQAAIRPKDQVRLVGDKIYVNNGIVVPLPKPFGLGVVFGSLPEAMLEKMYRDNPQAFDGFGKALYDSFAAPTIPNVATPMIEQGMNIRQFSDSPLIPQRLTSQLPEYQYTPYTTELTKALGMAFSHIPGFDARFPGSTSPIAGPARALTSPMLIENYVRGWTGPLGMRTLGLVDALGRKAGVLNDPAKPEKTWMENDFFRAFVIRHPQAGTRNTALFFERYEKNKAFLSTFRARALEGDVVAMDRIRRIGGEESLVKLDAAAKALSEHFKAARTIYLATEEGIVPPAEARQLLDNIYFRIWRMGDQAMEQINAMDRKVQALRGEGQDDIKKNVLGRGDGSSLENYPTVADAMAAQEQGFGYGTGMEGFLNEQNARLMGEGKGKNFKLTDVEGRTLAAIVKAARDESKSKNVDLSKNPELKEQLERVYMRAAIAVNRNPIAALGFDPNVIAIDAASGRTNIAGAYSPSSDSIWANIASPAVLVHESIHRGIEKMRKTNKEASDILRELDEESVVRYLMVKYAGDPEKGTGDIADQQRAEGLEMFEGKSHQIDRLMEIAQKLVKDQRPRGPR